MTVQDIVAELDFIKEDNDKCMATISDRNSTKEEKSECRARMSENNHERMHLESTLLLIKCDPYF